MKKIFVCLAILGLLVTGTDFSWGQPGHCGRDQFDQFVAEMAEAGAARQLAQADFPLTEYYDQIGRGCNQTRKMDRGQAGRFGALIPSQAEQRANNYTLRTEVRGDKGHLTLIKDGSWVFEKLEFTWRDGCWRLTGVKFEIDDKCR